MIKVIGNDAFLNFINLNNALLNNFSEKQINIFVIDKNKEIENLAMNKSYKNNENNIKIYLLDKKIKKKINQQYLSSSIFYPIKPTDFANLVKSITFLQALKRYGLSVSNNIAMSLQNHKKTNLTNTEIQILNLLVLGSKVERKLLETKVLNFKKEIYSNSLDSHLVRLRKKIKQINDKIEITSEESKHVKISLST